MEVEWVANVRFGRVRPGLTTLKAACPEQAEREDAKGVERLRKARKRNCASGSVSDRIRCLSSRVWT